MYAINRYNWINTLISSIGYIVCIILQTLIGFGQIPDLFKDSFSINGILGVISFSFVIFIIVGSKGKHLKVAVIIQIINILFLFLSVIFHKLYTPLPSIILGCVSIIVCCILSKYLKQLSENASTIDNLIYLDSLTGLLNKRGFMKELYIKSNQGKEFYLAMINLNDFRRISDITNHSEGDRILKDLAQSWLKIPMDFTLSYFGGGTFALVSEYKKYYIDNIISEMFNSIKLIDSEYNVLITLAVGVSHYTQDTNNIDQLVTYADTAMIKSKEAGKNKVTYFDYDSYNLIKNRYNIERNVRNALMKKAMF